MLCFDKLNGKNNNKNTLKWFRFVGVYLKRPLILLQDGIRVMKLKSIFVAVLRTGKIVYRSKLVTVFLHSQIKID